jgi:hypothetical protein
MLYIIVVAHLLGDYLFQWGFIARWKARSLMGVLAHGSIVTVTTVVCAGLVDPSWWPYAVLIGVTHTSIDVIRARFLRTTNSTWELTWYLLDQLIHLTVIVVVVIESGAPSTPVLTGAARLLTNSRVLACIIGYLLLLNPAWVLFRFTVRGVWGSTAAPYLGQGEKYGPMVERVLIASLVLVGLFYLVPLVLLPRRLASIQIQGGEVGVLIRPTGNWVETILSVSLAVAVGLILRVMIGGI